MTILSSPFQSITGRTESTDQFLLLSIREIILEPCVRLIKDLASSVGYLIPQLKNVAVLSLIKSTAELEFERY